MSITDLSNSEMLFYGGIAVMAAAVVVAIIATIVLRIFGKQLQVQLEAEFGKKQH